MPDVASGLFAVAHQPRRFRAQEFCAGTFEVEVGQHPRRREPSGFPDQGLNVLGVDKHEASHQHVEDDVLLMRGEQAANHRGDPLPHQSPPVAIVAARGVDDHPLGEATNFINQGRLESR